MDGSDDTAQETSVERDSGHKDSSDSDGDVTSFKPLIKGLISMGNVQFQNAASQIPMDSMTAVKAMPGYMSGVVINVTWAQIQPTSSTELDTTVIDNELAEITTYNAANPTAEVHAILRVASAANAPTWVLNLDGSPVSVILRDNGKAVDVPRWWTPNYTAKWQNLQAMLAAKYDSNPLVAQISNTACSNQSDEPYVTTTDATSIKTLMAAGYTDALYQACLTNSIHDYDGWTHTRVDFTSNAFESLDSGRNVEDPKFTQTVITAFRAALGERAILSNHDLSDPTTPGPAEIYPAIIDAGPPIEFQTHSPDFVGSTAKLNWSATIMEAAGWGATAVEVWPTDPSQPGWQAQSAANLEAWADELIKNSGE